MQEIGIESSLVEEMRKGSKRLEGRLGKAKFLNLKEGDLLSIREDHWNDDKIIDSLPDSLVVRINQILYFESFNEMFGSLDYKDAIPSAKSLEDALGVYGKYYSSKDEQEYGVVAILFDLTE